MSHPEALLPRDENTSSFMNIKTHVVSNSSHIGGYLIPYDHREKWMEEYRGMFFPFTDHCYSCPRRRRNFPGEHLRALMKYECVSPNLHNHVVGLPNCMAVHRCPGQP